MKTIEDRLGNELPEETTLRVDGLDVTAVTERIVLSRQLRNPLVTVKFASGVNVNLNNAGNAIDGPGFQKRDRVLLRRQATASENGIYYVARLAPTVLVRIESLDVLPSYRVRVRVGRTQANTQWLKSGPTTFVAAADIGDSFMEVDIDDYYMEEDETDDLPAFIRAQDSLDMGGTITFIRRMEYTFSSALTVKKKVSLRGQSTLNVNNATKLSFNGSHGIHAVFGDDPDFPDASGGWSLFEGLWLAYTGSNTEDNDYHGFLLETPVIIRDCTISDFPGHGIHCDADVNISRRTGANLNRFFSIRIYLTGLSGVYMAGGDSNASVGIGIDVTGCGRREVGCVKAQYTLHLTDTLGIGATVEPGRWVFSDSRYGLYYIARTGGRLSPHGTLEIMVEAYDNSLSREITPDENRTLFGSGFQYGYGTEYNLPDPETITNIIFPESVPEGLVVTNPERASQAAELGDAHGIWDNSFLGNTWIGCHATGSRCRHYLSIKKSSGALFEGCYTEIGNFGQVSPPNLRVGGMWGDPPGMPSAGLHRNTSALQLSHSIWKTEGPAGVEVRRGRQNTDQIDHFYTNTDNHGYFFQQAPAGPMQHTYAWQHQNSGKYSALGLTQPAHPRNRGHVIAPRGILTGRSGMRVGSGPTPPEQSIEEDVWNKGDTWFVVRSQGSAMVTGDPWLYVCSEKTLVSEKTYDLTWIVMLRWP